MHKSKEHLQHAQKGGFDKVDQACSEPQAVKHNQGPHNPPGIIQKPGTADATHPGLHHHPGIMQKPGIPAKQMQCTGTRERACGSETGQNPTRGARAPRPATSQHRVGRRQRGSDERRRTLFARELRSRSNKKHTQRTSDTQPLLGTRPLKRRESRRSQARQTHGPGPPGQEQAASRARGQPTR